MVQRLKGYGFWSAEEMARLSSMETVRRGGLRYVRPDFAGAHRAGPEGLAVEVEPMSLRVPRMLLACEGG